MEPLQAKVEETKAKEEEESKGPREAGNVLVSRVVETVQQESGDSRLEFKRLLCQRH